MNVSVAPARPAQTIGLQFVEQYYSILHSKPRVLHRFYTDASTLTHGDFSKPFEPVTDTVSSQEGIQRKIDSLAFEEATTQVHSVDSQYSLGGAVIVQVTGALSCKGKPKRSFVQTFFLAPQEKGFFVLNDMFRYLPEPQALSYVPMENGLGGTAAAAPAAGNGLGKAPATADPQIVPNTTQPKMPVGPPTMAAPVIETPTQATAAQPAAPSPVEAPPAPEEPVVEEPPEPVVEEAPAAPSPPPPEPEAPPAPQAPPVHLTYAERLKLNMQQKTAAATAAAAAPKTAAPPAAAPPAAAPAAPQAEDGGAAAAAAAPATVAAVGEEPLSASVLVKELPPEATAEKLEAAFGRFGALRRNGIALKEVKGKPSYAFVDFETVAAAQAALESQVEIDGQPVAIVEKKAQFIRAGRGGRGSSGGAGGRGGGPFPGGRGRLPGRGRGFQPGDRPEVGRGPGRGGGRGPPVGGGGPRGGEYVPREGGRGGGRGSGGGGRGGGGFREGGGGGGRGRGPPTGA